MDNKEYDSKTISAVAKHFDKFYASEVFAEIIDNFSSMCELLGLQPTHFTSFYPHLKMHVKSCQGMNLFKLLDDRAGQPIFSNNLAASNIKMVVVGAGPIGLRTAIESQLMGAKVTVIEKRTSFTRNNVLHLWPWVIEDLKSLGAKNFYPRFCTGTMNHISIRRLQCILLKTALCFGVEVCGGVEFQGSEEPEFECDPWRITVSPSDHPVCSRPVDVLIGAEGKRVTLPGFRRKEFRGKLAIAITANFINKRTTAEAVVDEISGVAFVYKQDFFNTLYDELGIALENIVYYKDETHYFVMTTKKHSLLDRNVLLKDLRDPIALLNPKNVNKEALYEYIRDACDYCTDYQLPKMEFALNHYNQPDVALFDFTSMFASANASHVIEKKSSQLLFGLVGDGLLEPFWPTGTGIARGFLGAFDCCWMIRQWAAGDMTPSEVLAERESILKLLPQTTQENITKDYKNSTMVPRTRYPTLHNYLYGPHQVQHLYSSDCPDNKDLPRFNHPSYKEISTKTQLKKAAAQRPVNSSMRFEGQDQLSTGSIQRVEQAQQNPADFYKKMMEKRADGQKQTVDTLEDKLEAKRIFVDSSAEKQKKGKEDISLKNMLNSQASKAEFVKKMSRTFGYGMPSNTEPKTDTLASEAEKCALLVKSSNMRQNKKKKSTESSKKSIKASQNSRDREIQPWDFGERKDSSTLHSSVAPIVPTMDIEIDPELDCLLAQLEHDDEFSKLHENDQKTWLESLFFQDTLHLPGRAPRSQLNPTKPTGRNTLRVNQEAGHTCTLAPPQREETVTAVHVNDKMKNLTQDFFKPKPAAPPPKERGLSNIAAEVGGGRDPHNKEERRLSSMGAEVGGGRDPHTKEKRLSIVGAEVEGGRDDSPDSYPSSQISRKSSMNSYATPPTSRKESQTRSASREPSINESLDETSGVNKNLCSLAQSYFSSPPKAVSRKSSAASDLRPAKQEISSFQSDNITAPPNIQTANRQQTVRQAESKPQRDRIVDRGTGESEKANLVAAFFGGGAKLNPISKESVRERVSYEPADLLLPLDDEEDLELDRIIQSREIDAPPVPPRKVDNKALMLRMLGNATGILAGKR